MAFTGKCSIDSAGINTADNGVHFYLKADDGSFDWTPFRAKQEYNREVLAIALAALTSNSKVTVQSEFTAPWSEVWWFDLAK